MRPGRHVFGGEEGRVRRRRGNDDVCLLYRFTQGTSCIVRRGSEGAGGDSYSRKRSTKTVAEGVQSGVLGTVEDSTCLNRGECLQKKREVGLYLCSCPDGDNGLWFRVLEEEAGCEERAC